MPVPSTEPLPRDGPPVVFVTVGTDHHPFDRLIGWVERWAATYAGEVVVQHGSGRPPAGVTAVPFLSLEQMRDHFRRAVAVVCAGGPGTIMSARAEGCVPVVVPRLAALGEVVDDHQQAFADLVAEEGLAVVVHDEAALREALDRAVADPTSYRFDLVAVAEPAGVEVIGALIDELLARRSEGRRRRRRPRRTGRLRPRGPG